MDKIVKTEKVETTEVEPVSGEQETTKTVTKQVEFTRPVETEISETVTIVEEETN